MNDAKLDKLLKTIQVPEPAPEYWERLSGRVSATLQWRSARTTVEDVPATRRPRYALAAWGVGLAVVCVILGFALGHWRGQSEALAANGLLQNGKVIQEMLSLFPNRIRAVVQGQGEFHLLLAEEADVPASTPLWIRICRGRDCVSLVTFSGQELEVVGQRLTVLASAAGTVIVLGDRFAWNSGDPQSLPEGFRLEARTLELAALH